MPSTRPCAASHLPHGSPLRIELCETLDPYRDCPGTTSRGVSKDYLLGQFR